MIYIIVVASSITTSRQYHHMLVFKSKMPSSIIMILTSFLLHPDLPASYIEHVELSFIHVPYFVLTTVSTNKYMLCRYSYSFALIQCAMPRAQMVAVVNCFRVEMVPKNHHTCPVLPHKLQVMIFHDLDQRMSSCSCQTLCAFLAAPLAFWLPGSHVLQDLP